MFVLTNQIHLALLGRIFWKGEMGQHFPFISFDNPQGREKFWFLLALLHRHIYFILFAE